MTYSSFEADKKLDNKRKEARRGSISASSLVSVTDKRAAAKDRAAAIKDAKKRYTMIVDVSNPTATEASATGGVTSPVSAALAKEKSSLLDELADALGNEKTAGEASSAAGGVGGVSTDGGAASASTREIEVVMGGSGGGSKRGKSIFRRLSLTKSNSG